MSTTTVQQIFEFDDEKVNEVQIKKAFLPSEIGTDYSFKRKIVWKNVFAFVVLHAGAFYGFYLALVEAYTLTDFFMWSLFVATGFGITAGAHRFYAHKSYKAKYPIQLLLIMLQTMAGQNCMYIWVRDHRQHHKFSDTDADPHNSNRGFFFSHMGWLMSKKHPLVISKGKTIDMSDLASDPLVQFQTKYYNPLYVIFAIMIPVSIPCFLWNETLWNSFFIIYFSRYVLVLHATWTVNSIAHFYGTKPYDKNMVPVESYIVAFFSGGEGWHNYHHAFPWDYKASEFGAIFNMTTYIIRALALFGLTYDLKEASLEMIRKKILKHGDGSHEIYGSYNKTNSQNTKASDDGDCEISKNVDPSVKPILSRG